MTSGGKIKLIAVVVIVLVLIGGCIFWAVQNGGKGSNSTKTIVAEAAIIEPGLGFIQTYDILSKENAEIQPNVPEYTVEPGLENVVNRKIYGSLLEPKIIEMIAKNGFAVTPTDYIQMFNVYENNEYQRPEKFPSFITTDSMLHTYHVFYDYTLRQVESYKLYDAAVELTNAMLKVSQEDHANAESPEIKQAARGNVMFFAVARNLLTGKPAPAHVKDDVAADLALIKKHEGFDTARATGVEFDFSQFVPRGHYTRTEKLKKYFRAMMWYGLSPMPIPKKGENDPGLMMPTRQALLITRNLMTTKSKGKPIINLWNMIYEPTAFYVGTADDYTFYEYSKLLNKVYGKTTSLETFADNDKLKQLIAEVYKLQEAGIDNAGEDKKMKPEGLSSMRQFRFMGQRYIPDSHIFRKLTDPYVFRRGFPRGLDAFAAMGSDRALEIMKTLPSSKKAGYFEQMDAMRVEMKNTPRDKWMSNLYYGWLWSLQSAVEPAAKGYPSFMLNTAWVDKSLITALGSWTELRHDTILYAKQSTAECGGADEEPPTPKGYVEPNLEFWTRLKWLNEYTKTGLSERDLLTDELKDKFEKLDDWLTFCRNITIKELTGKKVTEEEYNQICIYGAELEEMTLSFAGGDLISDADKDMAVVADVHTDSSINMCLEEGTGRASAIYVVVPIEGKLYLTRGATYTHYEFEWPMADRLTDETWQKMLNTGKTPNLPDWIKSFYIDTDKKPEQEFKSFSSGC